MTEDRYPCCEHCGRDYDGLGHDFPCIVAGCPGTVPVGPTP